MPSLKILLLLTFMLIGFIEDFFQKKENNHERIVAGIEDAKKRGTKFGRKCMQKPHES